MAADLSPKSTPTATTATNSTSRSSRPVSSHLNISPNDSSSPSTQNSSSSSLQHDTLSTSPASSSNSSHFVSSSPAAQPVPAQGQDNIPEIELQDLSDLEITPPPNLTERRQPPRSIPAPAAQQNDGTNGASVRDRFVKWLKGKFSVSNTIAFVTLLLSAVGLFLFGWRTYNIELNSNAIAYIQTCLNGPKDLTIDTSQCHEYVEKFYEGKMKPPYNFSKRAIEATRIFEKALKVRARKIMQRTAKASSVSLPTLHAFLRRSLGLPETEESSNPQNIQPIKIAIATGFVLFVGSLFVLRRMQDHARVEAPPFTCPGRSDRQRVRVERHSSDAQEQVTLDDEYEMLKHNPNEQDYLGQVRQQIRNSQQIDMTTSQESVDWASHNSSADTLITQNDRRRSTPSKINLRHSIDNGHKEQESVIHEGVIELPAKGKTKNFFDPTTGEFIHLAPWRSNEYEDEDSDDDEVAKGQVKQAFAQMTAGATALAGGKIIDERFLEEMEKWQSGAMEQKQRPPQRAGDCLAGLVTNEYPTGKPQTV